MCDVWSVKPYLVLISLQFNKNDNNNIKNATCISYKLRACILLSHCRIEQFHFILVVSSNALCLFQWHSCRLPCLSSARSGEWWCKKKHKLKNSRNFVCRKMNIIFPIGIWKKWRAPKKKARYKYLPGLLPLHKMCLRASNKPAFRSSILSIS